MEIAMAIVTVVAFSFGMGFVEAWRTERRRNQEIKSKGGNGQWNSIL